VSLPLLSLVTFVPLLGALAILAFNLPVSISPSILKSLTKDQNGWPKVAGLLPSIRKCPVQAKLYATTGHSRAYQG